MDARLGFLLEFRSPATKSGAAIKSRTLRGCRKVFGCLLLGCSGTLARAFLSLCLFFLQHQTGLGIPASQGKFSGSVGAHRYNQGAMQKFNEQGACLTLSISLRVLAQSETSSDSHLGFPICGAILTSPGEKFTFTSHAFLLTTMKSVHGCK